MIVGVTMAALARLLAEAGVDVALMPSMLAKGWGGSAVLNAKHARVEQRDYSQHRRRQVHGGT